MALGVASLSMLGPPRTRSGRRSSALLGGGEDTEERASEREPELGVGEVEQEGHARHLSPSRQAQDPRRAVADFHDPP